MIILIEELPGIPFNNIAQFLSKFENANLICINIKYYKYFYNHSISLFIYNYFILLKLQKKRPVKPTIYGHFSGIELFTNPKYKNKIMDVYRTNKNIINVIKKCDNLHYKYYFNNLNLISIDYYRILDIIDMNFNKNKLNYHITIFNYQSLNISFKKAKIFADNGHQWLYYKNDNFISYQYNLVKNDIPLVFELYVKEYLNKYFNDNNSQNKEFIKRWWNGFEIINNPLFLNQNLPTFECDFLS